MRRRRKRNILKQQASTHKHIPQRTCLACRQVKAKRELIRIVRTPGGEIELDSSGRKAGRGAYLCRASECWETGLKGNKLAHTLRGNLAQDTCETLLEEAQKLLKGAE